MCQSLPGRVVSIDHDTAWIEPFTAGKRPGKLQTVSLVAVEGVAVGDWVLHWAGLALERLSDGEAEADLSAWTELLEVVDHHAPRFGQGTEP